MTIKNAGAQGSNAFNIGIRASIFYILSCFIGASLGCGGGQVYSRRIHGSGHRI